MSRTSGLFLFVPRMVLSASWASRPSRCNMTDAQARFREDGMRPERSLAGPTLDSMGGIRQTLARRSWMRSGFRHQSLEGDCRSRNRDGDRLVEFNRDRSGNRTASLVNTVSSMAASSVSSVFFVLPIRPSALIISATCIRSCRSFGSTSTRENCAGVVL